MPAIILQGLAGENGKFQTFQTEASKPLVRSSPSHSSQKTYRLVNFVSFRPSHKFVLFPKHNFSSLMANKSVLVYGGSGQLGSEVVKAFKAAGN